MSDNPNNLPVRPGVKNESFSRLLYDWVAETLIPENDDDKTRQFVWAIPGILEAGEGIIFWWAPGPVMIREVSLYADTPPSSGNLVVDMVRRPWQPLTQDFGLRASVYTSPPTIAQGEDTGMAPWVYVEDGRFFRYRDVLRLDLTSTGGAENLVIMVRMEPMGRTDEIKPVRKFGNK